MNWKDGLNKNQLEAAECIDGTLLILAGAGSGKTKTMTHRMCHLIESGVPAEHILGITFTNKAANEMKDRMKTLLGENAAMPELKTFHSFGYAILKNYGELLGYDRHISVCDDDDAIKRLKGAVAELTAKDYPGYKDYEKNSDFMGEIQRLISQWKDEMLSEKEIEKIIKEHSPISFTAAVYRKYEDNLFKENVVDFDDLILKPVRLLLEYPNVRKDLIEKYPHISVDEFQDTSVCQNKLIELLSDGGKSLCVVGDDYQSIYAFRGAKVENILKFSEDHRGCKTVYLGENYRSTHNIVNAAAAVIEHNSGQLNKQLFSMNEEGERIRTVISTTDKDEAEYIASTIKKGLDEGKSPLDYAVLYRKNSVSRLLEERLIRYHVPYKIFGGLSFYQRHEVKDLIAYLKICAGSQDMIALRRILNVPRRKLGKAAETKLDEFFAERPVKEPVLTKLGLLAAKDKKYLDFYNLLEGLVSLIQEQSLEAFVKSVITNTGMEEYTAAVLSKNDSGEESRVENLKQVAERASEYEKENVSFTQLKEGYDHMEVLEGFLEEIALYNDIDTADDKTEYVSLMTMHKAKGLEFENVFLAHQQEDNIRLTASASEEEKLFEIEESRRLFYVGMTRAKKKLCISYCRTIYSFKDSRYKDSEPIRFIKEIPHQYMEISANKHPSSVTFRKDASFYDDDEVGSIYGDSISRAVAKRRMEGGRTQVYSGGRSMTAREKAVSWHR